LLDVDVQVGLKRRQKDGDVNRLDKFVLEFHQRVIAGYHEMAKAEPDRWVVIDANQTFEEVHQQIQQVVLQRLKRGN
jgi:dTMP kinase